MRRRQLLRVALALLAIGMGLASAAPAGAGSTTKSAWWSRATDPASAAPPAAQVPGVSAPALPASPPRPDVPDGSLLVEGTPAGATAVGAITYALAEGEGDPILTITPSESSNVPDDAVILACRAAIPWEAPETQPGHWADKPLVDCGRSVNGVIADGTVTFALGPLVSGSDLDVVLVAGVLESSTPAGSVGSSFSLSFDVAEGAALATTAASSSDSASSSFPSASSYSPSPAPSVYSAPVSYDVAPPVVQPALEPEEQAPTVPRQAALPRATPAATDDTAQGVAFLVLLAGLAFAGLAYATPARPDGGTVGLGRFRRPAPAAAFAEPVEPVNGGLGRFARPRIGPPPALS